jgi:hypothetical protein
MASYDDRKKLYQDAVLSEATSKHNFLTKAYLLSEVDETALENCCQTVQVHGNNADFTLIKLIRFLYFEDDHLLPHQNRIIGILSSFSFWPQKDQPSAVEKTCFWSENHIFMYLSSSHLFAQKCVEKSATSQFEEHLLLIYLTAHCQFEGVYEVNSAVYLPYTMASLLNLYDYSQIQEIREMAHFLLDKILTQTLLVCSVDGICTLSASARQYPRNRFRNYDHNINQVCYYCLQ